MKYRRLRIAFSAACGVLCLLLIALWVRSYWRLDQLELLVSPTSIVGAGYVEGTLVFFKVNNVPPAYIQRWKFNSYELTNLLQHETQYKHKLGFGVELSLASALLSVPLWFCVPATAFVSALPWIRYRFSLRTLLIATTIIGLLLGTIIIATTR